MQTQMTAEREIFLLTSKLSKLTDEKQIIEFFTKGLNSLFVPTKFEFVEESSEEDFIIPMSTANSFFGYIIISDKNPEKDELELITNAVFMVTNFLDRLQLQHTLENQLESIEQLYEEKSVKLKTTIDDLLASRIASMNLIEDLTEQIEIRKEKERELRESREKFQTILDETPVGIFSFDKHSVVTELNPSMEKIFGLKKSSIIGLNLLNAVTDQNTRKIIEDTLKKGESVFEGEYTSAVSKKTSYLKAIGKGIKNKDGKIVGGLGLVEDMSQKQKNDLLLKEQQEMLKNVLEGTDAGTWDWNYKTNELKINNRWAEIIGFTLEELKPITLSTWEQSLHPDDLKIANTKLERHLKGETENYNTEFRQKHKNGNWIWINAIGKITERDANGDIVRLSGTHMDISKRKQIELKLQKQNLEYEALNEKLNTQLETTKTLNSQLEIALEKAKESEELKSAFLANMSHEIRTPMNGILGFTKLLESPDLTEIQLHKYVDIIKKSGKRMLSTINGIIDISRIEAGQVELNEGPVNINTLLNDLYSFFQLETNNKNLDFKLKNNLKNTDYQITTDSEKLNAVLYNLIKNAIKYTKEGLIEFGCNKDEDNYFLYVKDTGIGIEKSRQEAIFDRFVQADIKDKDALEGSGLGLAISKAYVEMLGGNIWVNSQKGVGSVFYFSIPAKINKSKISNATTKKDIKHTNFKPLKELKMKALIVEDEEVSDNLLTIILSEFCDTILHAQNGKEAIEISKNNTDLDMIFMDIKLPELCGYEATKEIRKFNKKVKIIAQTAYALSGDREKSINSGCDDYISKPIMADQLKVLINKHIKIE
ncbi:MAG: hypothetical protein C0598_10610 [Marinilabiliales bacterium]|nr:MAG: hypothetical protein C0598_10610 [Marinilabiliales bacterium]